jgi:glycosyltransferase involved in cell wall biosynthesis
VLLLQGTAGFGGSKVSLLALVDALAGSGLAPLVACPGPGWLTAELERRGTAHVLVPFPAWRKWLERPRVGPTIRRRWLPAVGRWQVVLVHANEAWWAPHAMLAGRALGVPVAAHVRDGVHATGKAHRYRLARADRVLTVSTALRERFRADPDLWSRSEVVFNGHAAPPADAGARRAGERARLGAGPGDVIVGAAGRLCERKNQRLLIAALGALKDAGRLAGVRAVLAGEAEPSYAAALRADVAERGLAPHVVFAGHRPDLHAFFAGIDLLAHCATREGLPRVVPESMLAERPVVATPAEGIRDALPDDRHGIVVPSNDAGALAAAIATLAGDAGLRAAVAATAAARARELFSLAAHRRRMLEVYASLLGPRPSTTRSVHGL